MRSKNMKDRIENYTNGISFKTHNKRYAIYKQDGFVEVRIHQVVSDNNADYHREEYVDSGSQYRWRKCGKKLLTTAIQFSEPLFEEFLTAVQAYIQNKNQ